ncbi:MAG: hypothetical protein EOM20_05945 [Spartobacteria bacterium]|nr:hypothetical protein [Spartobacteria bacterium]
MYRWRGGRSRCGKGYVVIGAEATAHFAGDKADHRGAFVFGVRDQKEWFDGHCSGNIGCRVFRWRQQ